MPTTPPTFVAGDILEADQLNQLGVEGRGRLVEQQHLRVQRLGGDPLEFGVEGGLRLGLVLADPLVGIIAQRLGRAL